MIEMELVINVDFGGFSFDTEMALWLSEHRGWTVLPEKKYNYKEKYPINTLVEMSGDYFYSPNDGIELRSNKDLIDCVRALQILHENDDYPEAYYGHIHNLSIKKVAVHIEIENYYDGKERIKCRVVENEEE
jgi:hypothetical protein